MSRAEAVLDFIRVYHSRMGFSPSLREIARGVGLASPSTVQAHITNLIKAGRLTRVAGAPRTLRVVA